MGIADRRRILKIDPAFGVSAKVHPELLVLKKEVGALKYQFATMKQTVQLEVLLNVCGELL